MARLDLREDQTRDVEVSVGAFPRPDQIRMTLAGVLIGTRPSETTGIGTVDAMTGGCDCPPAPCSATIWMK